MKCLKKVDKDLLNLLQKKDACKPRVNWLARRLGLPASTVNTKLRKFEKEGYVKGYSTELNPDKLDRGFVAFKFGGKKFHKKSDLEEYGKKLAAIPEVQEVHFLVGEWDYIVKMRLKDKDEYTKVAPEIAILMDGCKGIISPKTFKDTHKFIVK